MVMRSEKRGGVGNLSNFREVEWSGVATLLQSLLQSLHESTTASSSAFPGNERGNADTARRGNLFSSGGEAPQSRDYLISLLLSPLSPSSLPFLPFCVQFTTPSKTWFSKPSTPSLGMGTSRLR